MAFNKILKTLRAEKGLYQKDLAKLLNTENYNVSNWEQGRTEPSLADIRKLCVILDISADEILEIETPEQREKVKSNIINNEKEIKLL